MKYRAIFVFLFAGLIAFFIESVIILFFINYFDTNAYAPRFLSLPIGILFTWYVNRTYGFQVKSEPNFRELLRYLKSNFLVQSLNFLLYILLISNFFFFKNNPIYALFFSVVIATIFSFILYLYYVFRNNDN